MNAPERTCLHMTIKQFEDKNLSHYSYAILSDCEKKIVLIDPARNPQPYLDFAVANDALITGVIETHPHADFVSSHLELHQLTGAVIYASVLAAPSYPYTPFDEGQEIQLGKIKLSALNTPGHSPDSICIVLEQEGEKKAVFTGDTLFIGDCGRPDLRPGDGNAKEAAAILAHQMYHSLRNKLAVLPDTTIVYPAHGAGTLCGKALSHDSSSTIGREKMSNWSMTEQTEVDFVNELQSGQPFVPAYFAYDVELNKKGAPGFLESLRTIPMGAVVDGAKEADLLNPAFLIIDGREGEKYKNGHLPNSINLINGIKFDTWLGTIVKPGEPFYLAGANLQEVRVMAERAAAIGYEPQIAAAIIVAYAAVKEELLDITQFNAGMDDYTIIDVRNRNEVKEWKLFAHSINIPLTELRTQVDTIPINKPIVVHCASGFRSAAGSSLLSTVLGGQVQVFDMGEAIKEYKQVVAEQG